MRHHSARMSQFGNGSGKDQRLLRELPWSVIDALEQTGFCFYIFVSRRTGEVSREEESNEAQHSTDFDSGGG